MATAVWPKTPNHNVHVLTLHKYRSWLVGYLPSFLLLSRISTWLLIVKGVWIGEQRSQSMWSAHSFNPTHPEKGTMTMLEGTTVLGRGSLDRFDSRWKGKRIQIIRRWDELGSSEFKNGCSQTSLTRQPSYLLHSEWKTPQMMPLCRLLKILLYSLCEYEAS